MKAGLVYGMMPHHLDHIGVIAHMMGIPLIVTEERLAIQARTYYPGLDVIYWDYSCVAENLVTTFDTIFCSMPRPLFDEAFFVAQKLLKKKVRTIWLPHGNSDKGHKAPSMEALNHDTTAWVYGQKMIDFLKEKNVFHHLDITVIGNFRYAYYQKRRAFYDELIDQIIPSTKKVILYAPTWKDAENSSSLDEALPFLVKNLPPEYTLVVKPHPNSSSCFDIGIPNIPNVYPNELKNWEFDQKAPHDFCSERATIAERQGASENKNLEVRPTQSKTNSSSCLGTLLLNDFPPIYPLLNRTSVYIGDMSSIGYDFLTFDRPMIFLNPTRRDPKKDPGLFLHQCGVTLKPEDYDKIYDFLDDQLHPSSLRKEVYNYTFNS